MEKTKEIKKDPKAKFKQILGFFLLTLPAGGMQFLAIYIFETLLGLEYYQAFAIGYAFATTWNFTINRKKNFRRISGLQKSCSKNNPLLPCFCSVCSWLHFFMGKLYSLGRLQTFKQLPWNVYRNDCKFHFDFSYLR